MSVLLVRVDGISKLMCVVFVTDPDIWGVQAKDGDGIDGTGVAEAEGSRTARAEVSR